MPSLAIKTKKTTCNRPQGFTLLELVVVMVMLAILAIGSSSFLQFGSQIFIQATDRDEIISSARFVIERINRELRGSIPNSVEEYNNSGNTCLHFIPILQSAKYLDIAVEPESASKLVTLVPYSIDNIEYSEVKAVGDNIVVYPLNSADIYSRDNIIASADFSVVDETTQPYSITLTDAEQFIESPSKRIYFFKSGAMYCPVGTELYRHEVTYNSGILNIEPGILMAENLSEVVFSANTSNRTTNATIQMTLVFSKNQEIISFSNEVHVPNAS